MTESDALSLGPKETVSGRPFTAVELIGRDISVLQGILDDLVRVLSEADLANTKLVPHERIVWQKEGLTRRLLVCDEDRLRDHQDACVVGFFGERRTDMDIGPLEEANSAIVAQFRNFPGILSYSSIELPNGYWANMVLHDDPVDREYWSRGALHAQAARTLGPIHYRTVRIHNARLTAGVLEQPSFAVKTIKYWDYSEETEWVAERELAG